MFAVHTVFLPRENNLFLKQWIDHNIACGASDIHLYDNTGSQGFWHGNANLQVKDGIDGQNGRGEKFGAYTAHLSDAQVQEQLANIVAPYKNVFVHKWQPVDSSGKITYSQNESMEHFRTHYRSKYKWTAFIDVDEYLWYKDTSFIQLLETCDKSRIIHVELYQKRFMGRYANSHAKQPYDIHMCSPQFNYDAYKYICRLDMMTSVAVHVPQHPGIAYRTNPSEFRFNHYNMTPNEPTILDHDGYPFIK